MHDSHHADHDSYAMTRSTRGAILLRSVHPWGPARPSKRPSQVVTWLLCANAAGRCHERLGTFTLRVVLKLVTQTCGGTRPERVDRLDGCRPWCRRRAYRRTSDARQRNSRTDSNARSHLPRLPRARNSRGSRTSCSSGARRASTLAWGQCRKGWICSSSS